MERHLPARLQVLSIEDNPVDRLLLQQWAKWYPALQLEFASSGETGLRRARDEAFDLVLLDMHLDDMHGLQVLQALRQAPATALLPVVVLSACAFDVQIEQARHAGAQGYVTKPIQFGTLLQALCEGITAGLARSRSRAGVPAGSLPLQLGSAPSFA